MFRVQNLFLILQNYLTVPNFWRVIHWWFFLKLKFNTLWLQAHFSWKSQLKILRFHKTNSQKNCIFISSQIFENPSGPKEAIKFVVSPFSKSDSRKTSTLFSCITSSSRTTHSCKLYRYLNFLVWCSNQKSPAFQKNVTLELSCIRY